jgi:hypothetical protein
LSPFNAETGPVAHWLQGQPLARGTVLEQAR